MYFSIPMVAAKWESSNAHFRRHTDGVERDNGQSNIDALRRSFNLLKVHTKVPLLGMERTEESSRT